MTGQTIEFLTDPTGTEVTVNVTIDNDPDQRYLQVKLTDEGVIIDAFLNGEHTGTASEMYDEILERLHA